MNHPECTSRPCGTRRSKFRPLFQKALLIWCGGSRWREILQTGFHPPRSVHAIASWPTRPAASGLWKKTEPETLYLLSHRRIDLLRPRGLTCDSAGIVRAGLI